MKISFVGICSQCLLLNLLIAGDIEAQKKSSVKEVIINIDVENASILQLFEELEEKTQFQFTYDHKTISKIKARISLSARGKSVEEVLLKVSKEAKLRFKQVDNNINVSPLKDKFEIPIEIIIYGVDISGKITDENGQGLPGASVVVKGTTNGVTADLDGNYKLSVPDDAILLISFVGYINQEVSIAGRSSIDVQMQLDTEQLEEIVVVGYGTQKRNDVTGSIASVESSQISSRPIASVEDAMQGLIPGLNIAQRASSPGELGTVSIRGLGSITAGTSPLWVVDGFPTDQRNAQAINPADIQSVDVLKDASSTAIYGSRGANGVIIITTKSGKEGSSNINFTATSGVSSVPNSARQDVMNAEQYVQYRTEQNGGTAPDYISDIWDGQTDTDWVDLTLRSASFQNYAISASGGSEKVSYLISGNYIDQEGVVKGEGQKKYSARAKIDFRPSNRITFGLNLAPNITTIKRNSVGTDDSDWGSLYAQSLMLAPILPIRRADGTYSMNSDIGGLPVGNPLETIQNYDFNQTLLRLLAGLSVSAEVVDGLTLRSSISTNFGTNRSENLYQPTVGQDVAFTYSAVSSYNTSQGQQIGWLNENTVNYRKSFDDHSIDVIGGFTLQRDEIENVSASASELQVPGVRNVNIGNSDNLRGSNSKSENSLVSYLGRLNYAFKGKYLLTATVRADGSSRFGTNNRYKTFGSFALAWRFSEESFLDGVDALSNGKLRVSYGSTGSNAIPNFSARADMGTIRHSFGSNAVFGTRLGNPGNQSLSWETSKQLDIGLDLGFSDNRYNLVIDYFNNETTSLLLTKGIVPSSGYSSFLTNIGSMSNKGIEITANARIIETSDFAWSVGANFTTNNQEILDLGGEDELQNFFGALRRVVGGELQQIRGPKVLKIARAGDDQSAQPLNTPGAYIYEDVDGDGAISNFLGADGQLVGDTNVDLIYGITTNLRYKNFGISALLNGQSGAYVYDFWQIQVAAPFRRTNLSTEYWYDGRYVDESNPGDGKTPAANGFDTGVGAVSSAGVQKTDYLRIRNVTFTYNLPNSVLEKFGMANGRVFTSIENLHTFTSFVGGNPEARRASAGGPALIGGSQIASVTDGRELGLNSPPGLPLPRVWTLGVSVNF